jgi:hypothetical protein
MRDETTIFDLATLSPHTRLEKNLIFDYAEWQPQSGYELIAISGDLSHKGDLKLNFGDKDLALRGRKALRDAVLRCGGKKTEEIY